MSKKPNVLFLLTDDQRYNTIHALGNEQVITPSMDEIVQRGTSFVQAHIPGGTSGAVCMPSRAMINSGRTLFHLQGEGQNIPTDHTTLGQCMKENGYHCFGTGKWHNGCESFTRSFSSGDNVFFGGMWDHWNVPTNYYDPTGEYDNVINFVMNYNYDNHPTKVHCDKFNPGVHSSELLSNTVIDFIKNYDKEEPFYAYTAYLAPHDPRTMPDEFKNMYNPDEIIVPENFVEEHFEFGVSQIRDEVLAPYPRTHEEMQRQIAEYYGMITHLDNEIGHVLQALKDKGIYEDTIIILAGDNGLAIGNHGLMGKQNHYEHSIRIPLVFAGPGIPQNEIRNQYVYLMDIFPTLCDVLGLEIPTSVEGKSFAKMFTKEDEVTRETLYFVYNDLIRSVKDSQYKLIQYKTVADRIQLFDIVNDPMEINDLSKDPAYGEKIDTLSKLLITYRDESGEMNHKFGQSFWK
ncbi:MAG: sulfatase-like hydrolase/transferase [Lachnospiraceae bacterium]